MVDSLKRGAHWLAAGWLLVCVSPAVAGHFAAEVISYDPGAAAGLGYTDPSAALGAPTTLTGAGFGFPGVVSPFNPPFEPQEVVQIGEGGHLTLRLSHFALPVGGLQIGVFTNVGIADEDYPNGQAGDPPFTFGVDSAVVEVSADGVTWVDLGNKTFDMPTNAYLDRGPFDSEPGSLLADAGKPLAGSLSDFAGLDYPQMLTLLDGSAGGTWLDIWASGLSQVGYIRFSLPDDGDAGTQLTFELDAVSVAGAAVGALVPEPQTWLLLATGWGTLGMALARRRRLASQQG